jgi:hypothetical protein
MAKDAELTAINAIDKRLDSLNDKQRQRVVRFIVERENERIVREIHSSEGEVLTQSEPASH